MIAECYMGYRAFSWPRLPDTLCMRQAKYTAVLPQPKNGETVQELGHHGRLVTGKGVFLGNEALPQWAALCGCYEQAGAGPLYLPGRAPIQALFTELSLCEAPRADRVAYQFTFQELPKEKEKIRTFQTREGETLWSAAAATGSTPECLLEANPGKIRWPNELPAGMELKVP